MRWVQNCQGQSYFGEIASIKSEPCQSGMKKPQLVRQSRLFIEDTGLLCCGGQIHNAPLSKATKFPCLLQQDNHLTSLIVNQVHFSLSHASTLTSLRKSFWIPSGHQLVKKLLRHCITCRKHGGRPYATPESAPLQKLKVQDPAPFTITGIDFTEPCM